MVFGAPYGVPGIEAGCCTANTILTVLLLQPLSAPLFLFILFRSFFFPKQFNWITLRYTVTELLLYLSIFKLWRIFYISQMSVIILSLPPSLTHFTQHDRVQPCLSKFYVFIFPKNCVVFPHGRCSIVLSTHLFSSTQVVSCFWLLWTMLQWTQACTLLFCIVFLDPRLYSQEQYCWVARKLNF